MENKCSWKNAVLNAMKSYNMDISHYEDRPDDALCDLLYMHTNAEVQKAIIAYEASRGETALYESQSMYHAVFCPNHDCGIELVAPKSETDAEQLKQRWNNLQNLLKQRLKK